MQFGIFIDQYADEDRCLEVIKKIKYSKGIFCKNCQEITKFYKVKNRPLYECSCGFQISPLKGTIFQDSKISLQSWFYALFVMSNTRSGFSAAHLQRDLGVNYKTAWRMLHKIRKAMVSDNSYLLKGIVEIDETYVGWRRNTWYGDDQPDAAVVMGMVERGGKARYRHVPTNSKIILLQQIQRNISTKAHIMSDQLPAYKNLDKYGYKHDSVLHRVEYVRGDIYTQTIESHWGTLKRSISGTYRKTSKKWLQNYLNEFEWRYNHRKEEEKMFGILIKSMIKI